MCFIFNVTIVKKIKISQNLCVQVFKYTTVKVEKNLNTMSSVGLIGEKRYTEIVKINMSSVGVAVATGQTVLLGRKLDFQGLRFSDVTRNIKRAQLHLVQHTSR